LGSSVAEAFGYHFYAYLGLSREDIPSHLKEFSSALDGSFGVGGRVLARAICRKARYMGGVYFIVGVLAGRSEVHG